MIMNSDLIAEARAIASAKWAAIDTSEDADLLRRLADALEERTTVADTMFTSEYVDALRAELEPRVVSTVAELDALPVGAVVRAGDGDVCEKMPVKFSDQTTDIRWRSPSWEGVLSEHDITLPATVLWVGGTE